MRPDPAVDIGQPCRILDRARRDTDTDSGSESEMGKAVYRLISVDSNQY